MEMNYSIRMLKDKMDLGKYIYLTKERRIIEFTIVENEKY
jgi:hypothetical protein